MPPSGAVEGRPNHAATSVSAAATGAENEAAAAAATGAVNEAAAAAATGAENEAAAAAATGAENYNAAQEELQARRREAVQASAQEFRQKFPVRSPRLSRNYFKRPDKKSEQMPWNTYQSVDEKGVLRYECVLVPFLVPGVPPALPDSDVPPGVALRAGSSCTLLEELNSQSAPQRPAVIVLSLFFFGIVFRQQKVEGRLPMSGSTVAKRLPVAYT